MRGSARNKWIVCDEGAKIELVGVTRMGGLRWKGRKKGGRLGAGGFLSSTSAGAAQDEETVFHDGYGKE